MGGAALAEGQLQFRILGALEVVAAGKPLQLGAPKERALLALLLVHRGQPISSDRLVEELWADQAPPRALGALQVYVSHLRKLLEPGRRRNQAPVVLQSRGQGYVLAVEPDQVDLARFERLFEQGHQALRGSNPESAAGYLIEALALFRGPPLADFAYEEFAQAPTARLEELRLAAQEDLLEARLALGGEAELVGSLEELIAAHPLRERLRAQLMLALYRSGRQADALAAYHDARRALVDELGIEPTRAVQDLERRILAQDPSLDVVPSARHTVERQPQVADRAVLVVASDSAQLDRLAALARQLASGPRPHELIFVLLLAEAGPDGAGLADASLRMEALQLDFADDGVLARATAFTTPDPAADAVRFASRAEVDLLILAGAPGIQRAGELDEATRRILSRAPCDVAVWTASSEMTEGWESGPVVVPFGAGEHEWAALEVGAWLARARQSRLELVGTIGDSETQDRDASRLLADASLLAQRALAITPRPRLVSTGHRGVVEAAGSGGTVVAGLSERWATEGLGVARWSIVRSAKVQVLLVHRGLRPGGLAPTESLTRYSWSTAGI